MLLDAAGFDVVLVETVGVGQDEVEIARLADVTLVVMVPGMGDDVQAIKAGIMEIADVFVINKSDLPGAEKLERELNSYLACRIGRTAGRRRSCTRWRATAKESRSRWQPRANIMPRIQPIARREIWAARLREMLRERLLDRLPAEDSPLAGAKWPNNGAIHIRFCMTGSNESKIDHLGIAVRSLDAALEFYRDQLGPGRVAARNRGARKSQRRDAARWASRASSCWSRPKPIP